MAAPQIVQVVGGAGSSFATAAGTAVGDYLVAFQATGLTATGPGAQPGGTYTTGWTLLADLTAQANGKVKAWYRRITDTGGAKTVTVTGGNATYGDWLAVAVVRDASDINFLDGTVSTVYTIGSGALTIPAGITTTVTDSHLLAFWFVNHISGTAATGSPPVGMTELLDQQTTNSGIWVGSEVKAVAGAVGSRTLSTAKVPFGSYPSGAVMLAIRPSALPVDASDQATGSDTVTVAPQLGVAEVGAGTDSASLTGQLSASDAGVGTEQVPLFAYTGQVEVATGSDTATAQALQPANPADTGTGAETVGITSILDATTDTGVGSEKAVGLLRQSTIGDTGTGSEKTVGIGPTLTDSGVGIEDVRVREIAATRVLPIVPERRYEVVVAARIQQASGAPTFLEVEAVTWLSLSYTDTLSAPQDLTLTCQLATLPENVLQHLRRPDLFPFELWVRRDGQIIFAGPLQGWQVQDQKVTIKASGLLAYLSMMGLDFDRQFLGADQAVVVKTLVDAWQISEYGHFGIDTTAMTPTGRLVDQTYLRDELPNLLRAVQELGVADGGFDIEVDPQSRQLTTWSPQRGTDRSEGEDAIVLDTRNVTSSNLLCSIAPADLASDVFATGSKSGGDAPLFTAVTNAELRAKYGRTVTTRSYSNVADQATLEAYAAAVRDARGRAFVVPGTKVRVTPDADIADYREGDTVAYDLGGELGTSGAFRIRSRTVTVDESGRESVDLEPV